MITLGAAVGGATGKFVEKVWDSGEKWIESYFKDHKVNVQKKASENSLSFLNELAKKVQLLEEENKISRLKLEEVQDQPDFSSILQKAILSSSVSESKEKHIVLADLVAKRILAESDSVFSMASKLACESIEYLTVNQLKILGISTLLFKIRPELVIGNNFNQDAYQKVIDAWLIEKLGFFSGLNIEPLEFTHMQSLSCLSYIEAIQTDLNSLFDYQSYKYIFLKNFDVPIKNEVLEYWKNGLSSIVLSSTGQVVGASIVDFYTKRTTSFKEWK